jgi:hypothetical protein
LAAIGSPMAPRPRNAILDINPPKSAFKPFEIKPDRAAQQDIDIFEGNGVHVGGKQAAKAGEIRPCRAIVADPGKIGVEE